MKKTLLLTIIMVLALAAQAQKYVGGDLSLVPAYEAAGDIWLDADGNSINTKYSDGMITYVHEVAGWNAVRVRLLVDPTADDNKVDDDFLATCQDLEYVKKLGKRIKDAGMDFLLDIFYSDTWTDVSKQWIPASWGYNRTTATETLAAKVKDYTKEVIDALTDYGAKPDFIQLGNEVSYGMLWDNLAGSNKSNWFTLGSTYQAQETNIKRFATLLKAAKEGVDASKASSAKIILHCERTYTAQHCVNFYKWVELAGFTGYDIIGLSYYPIWHGALSYLKSTLQQLESNFPTKKIHIVETGYHNKTPDSFKSGEYNTSSTWAYSPAGQADFIKALIAELQQHANVTGLYYWQPEECGNGADSDGKNRVMSHWDNRGFWSIAWKSGQHALNSKDALMAMKTFNGDAAPQQGTDVTSQFGNMDFENGESNMIWTVNYDGWGTSGPWPKLADQWHSPLVSGYLLQGWCEHANTLSAGNIFYQSKDNMPAGTYTVSAIVHTDYDGIYLFANDDTKIVPATSAWGTAYQVEVSTTLSAPGALTIGLKLSAAPTQTGELNLYADNFKVTGQTTGIQHVQRTTPVQDNVWYTLDGRRLNGKPATRGLYINNGKKYLVK